MYVRWKELLVAGSSVYYSIFNASNRTREIDTDTIRETVV